MSHIQNSIPKLRFPEFSGEWEAKKILDLGEVITGGTPDTSDESLYSDDFDFITPSDMNVGRYVLKAKRRLSEKGFRKSRAIPAGATLFVCIGSTIGKTAQTTSVSSTNQQINAIVPSDKYDNDFVFLALDKIAPKIARFAGEQAVPIVSKGDFQKNTLRTPRLSEQEKIAGFLTVVDERVATMSKKMELLEQYKKGVMQKIFSQKLRFKDENESDYPDWQEKKLGDIGKIFTGLTGKSGEDFGEGKPYITYMQIFGNSKIEGDFGKVRILPNEKQSLVLKGDIFFTTSSETALETGYTSTLLEDYGELYLNSFCFGYRPNLLHIIPNFARYLFHSHGTRKKIARLAQGSTRYNISKNEVMKLALSLPSVKEQQKIADFITSLDDKINLEKAKLEQAKLFKKSLLQRMFV